LILSANRGSANRCHIAFMHEGPTRSAVWWNTLAQAHHGFDQDHQCFV
jgi:hypothetical protein